MSSLNHFTENLHGCPCLNQLMNLTKRNPDLTVKYYKENELDITYGRRRKDKTEEEKHWPFFGVLQLVNESQRKTLV